MGFHILMGPLSIYPHWLAITVVLHEAPLSNIHLFASSLAGAELRGAGRGVHLGWCRDAVQLHVCPMCETCMRQIRQLKNRLSLATGLTSRQLGHMRNRMSVKLSRSPAELHSDVTLFPQCLSCFSD